jgi:hypothetical protein
MASRSNALRAIYSAADVKDAVKDRLGRESLDGEVWLIATMAKRPQWIATVAKDDQQRAQQQVDELVTLYQAIERYGAAHPSTAPTPTAVSIRDAAALAALVALDVARHPRVLWLRKRWDLDPLLARDQVEPWIQAEVEKSGAHRVWIEVPVAAPGGRLPGADPLLKLIEETVRRLRESGDPWRVFFRSNAISYLTADGEERSSYVGEKGRLNTLKECATEIIKR